MKRTAAACFCWVLLANLPLRAQAGAQYAELLKEGVSEFSAGNWAEARLLFVKAHALSPTARTFRGLAVCDFELRHYATAVREFESALRDVRRPLTAELRGQVEHALERARQYVPRYKLRLPSDFRALRVDGEEVEIGVDKELMLDPGTHALRLERNSAEPVEREVVAEVGTQAELSFEPKQAIATPSEVAKASDKAEEVPAPYLPPQGGSARPRTFTWVAAGFTAVFGAGIAAFGLTAKAKHDQFNRESQALAEQRPGANAPSASLVDSGKTFQTLTNASIIGCAASAAATVALFFVEGSSSADGTEHPPLQAGLGVGGAYLSGRF